MTKQGQETINRKFRNLEHRNRQGNLNAFYDMANRITSRDYNPIFDTDFASLVRYDRFPSLLYGSGATFLKIGLWYGGAASSLIPIFSVYSLTAVRCRVLVVVKKGKPCPLGGPARWRIAVGLDGAGSPKTPQVSHPQVSHPPATLKSVTLQPPSSQSPSSC